MGFLLKCIFFIPKMILKILVYPFKQLFNFLVALITLRLIAAAVLFYFYKKNPSTVNEIRSRADEIRSRADEIRVQADQIRSTSKKIEELQIPEKIDQIRSASEKIETLQPTEKKGLNTP